jgi:hypothetical protein
MVRWGGMVLLIPWLWIRTSNPIIMSYIIFMNVVFWIAMRKDIKQFYLIYRAGGFKTQAEWSDFLDMSSRPGHFIDQYSLPALLKRLS